ncbi:hypothetical protein GGX14DRAFT_637817 [Mycena pura]|uniref:Uncharacterized protein n=1 Tax=Mycena pura TaxID=153505 RepID=A0AAD6YF85_9AGAR|nr:hypothetical protein GGX14DRAFT_637817 [Mycena pura]
MHPPSAPAPILDSTPHSKDSGSHRHYTAKHIQKDYAPYLQEDLLHYMKGRSLAQFFECILHITNSQDTTRMENDSQFQKYLTRYNRWDVYARAVRAQRERLVTEHSIQNGYCTLIDEAEHFIYIENQFFISSTYKIDEVKNQIAAALVKRIVRAAQADEKFQVIVTIHEVPGFSGNIKDQGSLDGRPAGYEPLDYIRFYHLRAYDRINAPPTTYIQEIEEKSGVKYHEAQIALACQWIGNDDSGQKTVALSLSTETVPPILESEDAARLVIEHFEKAAREVRRDEDVADNVAQHMLHDRTSLMEEKWLGSEQEELDVSELLYIHTKLMIVDDNPVIMGFCPPVLMDGVTQGDGDSEIALVVEDGDMIQLTMNGKPCEVARFATTLRHKIFREHLGLIPPQTSDERDATPTSFMRPAPTPNEDETGSQEDALVADPLSAETLALWNDTARKNREIFTEIFRPVPTNLVRDGSMIYVPKIKAGHVVPGIPLDRVKKQLSQDFLIDEKSFVTGREWEGLDPTLPIYI